MQNPIEILSVRRVTLERGSGITVIFTDGTFAHYPPEELLELRPYREKLPTGPITH